MFTTSRHIFAILILVLSLLCISSSSSLALAQQNDIIDEKSILLQAVSILNEVPPSFNCTSNWLDETPLCNFTGVTCSNNNDNNNNNNSFVIGLSFVRCNFQGDQLPVFLFSKLRFVESFYIAGSLSFAVPIPEEFGDMTSLKALAVDGNSFVGNLPKGIGKLQNLQNLSFSSNPALTGGFPEEWGNLSSLQTLVSSNIPYLGGSLPKSFGNLSNLEWFACVDCGLEGELPEELSKLTKLASLNLGSNNLIKGLPAGFSRLPNLRSLIMSGNQLSILPSWNDSNSVLNLEEFTFARNNFSNIPLPTWKMAGCKLSDLSSNQFIGEIPDDIATLMPSLQVLDLSNNLLSGHVPSSFASLIHLKIFSVAGNCISTDSTHIHNTSGNTSSFDLVSYFAQNIPGLTTFDLTPGKCLHMRAINTSAQLSSPYTFLRANSWGSGDAAATKAFCAGTCDYRPFYGAVIPGRRSRVWLLTFFCTASSLITFAQTLTFDSSCVTGLFRAVLLCFVDAQGTIPCDPSLLPRSPSWNNATQKIQTLPDSTMTFEQGENAQYLHGAYYSIIFTVGANFWNGTYAERVIPTPFYQGPNCDQSSSVAVYMSTTCSPCVLFGKCDGTISIQVGEITPAWRFAPNLLPFYECPKQTTSGCWVTSNNNNGTIESTEKRDGSTCRENYQGPLLARCKPNYGKLGPNCVECLSNSSLGLLFGIGIVVLVILITGVVYITLDPEIEGIVKKDEEDERKKLLVQEEKEINNYSSLSDVDSNKSNVKDDNDTEAADEQQQETEQPSCCEKIKSLCDPCRSLKQAISKKLKQILGKYRAQLERVVIVVRQLVNHFSLVGALASVAASQQMLDSVQKLLLVQQSGNTFAFGSYAATLSCMFPDASSTSVLEFNLVWAVFGGVFVVESLIFLAWFRRGTVTAAVALFLSFLAYAPLTENAAKMLSLCDDFNFYDSSTYLLSRDSSSLQNPKKVIRLLSSDLAQDCDDPNFVRYRIGAALTLALFSVGLPIFILFVHRKLSTSHTQQQQEVAAAAAATNNVRNNNNNDENFGSPVSVVSEEGKQTENNTNLSNHQHLHHHHHENDISNKKKFHFSIHKRIEVLEFLTQAYRHDVWFWELCVMGRKTAIALILGVFPGHSALQLQFYTAVCTILLGLSISLQPLETVNANRVEQASILSAGLCAVMISLVATFPDSTSMSVFAAVVIFVTQITVLITILFSSFGILCFSNNAKLDDDDDEENKKKTQHQEPASSSALSSPLIIAPSEVKTTNNDDDAHHFVTSDSLTRVENSRKKIQSSSVPSTNTVEELKKTDFVSSNDGVNNTNQKKNGKSKSVISNGEESEHTPREGSHEDSILKKKDEEIAQLKKMIEEIKLKKEPSGLK